MYLRELTLDHFRSYEHLSLALEPGLTLVLGDNGTGKSNLLEAIYALATTRSMRASSEGEVIAWDAPMPPIARVAGTAQRLDGPVSVELAIVARTTPDGSVVPAKSGAPLTSKRLRANGIPRRASEVIGLIGAVLFTTLDIEIISGSPRGRRRYLDMMIAQSDREYARTFSRYDKGLTQRNALLKRIGEGQATASELVQWDDVVVEGGAMIIAARSAAVRELASAAATHHRHVAASDPAHVDGLELRYLPALGESGLPDDASREAVAEGMRAAFAVLRGREIAAGTTLAGPHRDDVAIELSGRSLAAYGSRAQQRSVALALRMAEADVLRERSGESPVLLLDDVFSELDPARRAATAEALEDAEQVIVTTADASAVPGELREPVASYRVAEGRLTAV